MDCLHCVIEICSEPIHLVDEDHARNFVCIGLAPNSFRLRLHTRNRFEHNYTAVEHTERTLYFSCEVNVTRGVDNVDLMAIPLGVGSS